MNCKGKRKWLISLTVTFAILFSTVETTMATELIGPDVQPTTTADTGSTTEKETEEEAESEMQKGTEKDSESETQEEESEEDSELKTRIEEKENEEDSELKTQEGKNKKDSELEIQEERNNLPEDPNNELSVAPEDSDSELSIDFTPAAHEHIWSMDWNYDESYHWHECTDEDCPVTDNSEKDGYAEHSYGDDNICTECGYFVPYVQLARTVQGAVPSYQEAYEAMIALKEKYYEGMTWTNFTPYGSDGPLGDSYIWKGGSIYGADRGVGCMAFAFLLSDAAFGSLPARAISGGSFTFEDVKVGDILRINGNSHSVIVLQKSAGGVIIAEANYNKSVHWGRAMSEAEVLSADFMITRYPEGYAPSDGSADNNVTQNGTVGNLSWSLTNSGVLTFSGSGAIPDYSQNNLPPWNGFSVSTIVIEKGVTGIGDYAFYQSGALNIYIPDGIVKIGQSAFEGSKLISVTIPGTVGSIGDKAFFNCVNLTSVTVPQGVKTIGNEAFRACTSLSYIDFPASITSIGSGAFMSCSGMTRVRFMPGNGTVTLGDNLFSQCWKLTSVTLPLTADRISDGMFASCTLLPSLYIPASIKEIGDNPFTSCNFLGYIYFGGSETEWNALTNPYLEASLKSTGTTVIFNAEFDDPFAADPNDPGDISLDQNIGESKPNPDQNASESNSNPDQNVSESNSNPEHQTDSIPAADSSDSPNDNSGASSSNEPSMTNSPVGDSNLDGQHEYIQEHNEPLNFASRPTYSEMSPGSEKESADTNDLSTQDQQEIATTPEELSESDKEELSENDKEEVQQVADEEVKAENNSKSNRAGIGIIVTVLIALVVAVPVAVFAFKRKVSAP